jgi:hypothetical protein
VNVEFLSTVAVIAPDPVATRELYVGALGLPLEGQGNGYYHSERIAGCKSFGIWPLSQAAEACFGTPRWPPARAVPQVSIEFDVGDAAAVGSAAEELEQAGYDCCTRRAQSRGVRRSPGYSRRKARSSASRTSPCSTTRTDGLPQPTGPSGNIDPPLKGRRRAALRLVSLPRRGEELSGLPLRA